MTGSGPETTRFLERAALAAPSQTPPNIDSQRLQACYSIAESLVANLQLDQVLQEVLDTLLRLFDYDRCVVARVGAEGDLAPWVGRPEGVATPFSRTIASSVLTRREALLCDDVQGEAPFELGASVMGLHIRSVLCAPTLARGRATGVLYLDRSVPGAYGPEDLALLVAVSRMVAISLENARLHAELQGRYERVSDDLRKAEQAAGLGRLALAVAHEVRNPATVIGVLSARLERKIDDAEVDQALTVIREEVKRLERMVGRLDELIELPEPQVVVSSLADTVNEAVEKARPAVQAAGLTLEVRCRTSAAEVPHDPFLTRAALGAVLENACDGAPEGETLMVDVSEAGDGWRIAVTDRRCGLPPEEMREVCDGSAGVEPWAADLALALAHRAVTVQGGSLLVGGRADAGTRVQIVLPRRNPLSEA